MHQVHLIPSLPSHKINSIIVRVNDSRRPLTLCVLWFNYHQSRRLGKGVLDVLTRWTPPFPLRCYKVAETLWVTRRRPVVFESLARTSVPLPERTVREPQSGIRFRKIRYDVPSAVRSSWVSAHLRRVMSFVDESGPMSLPEDWLRRFLVCAA